MRATLTTASVSGLLLLAAGPWHTGNWTGSLILAAVPLWVLCAVRGIRKHVAGRRPARPAERVNNYDRDRAAVTERPAPVQPDTRSAYDRDRGV
ncbi:hypothetical protein [Kitasatospora purpeofusca]|uniref:hypothetical protein n=1 Tax=Kitasatospora purpeofusca TaxID=67352 RepID=UPI0036A459BD